MKETGYNLIGSEKRKELLGIWAREGGLSGASLKLLACFFMLLDHMSQGKLFYESLGIGAGGIFHFWTEPRGLAIGSVMVLLGRIAFPLYCFFLVQGMFLTRDYRKYISRLFLFGLISEIPFDLGLFGALGWGHQNVFFTLFLGAGMILSLERVGDKLRGGLLILAKLAIIACIAYVAEVARVDYGSAGIFAILAFYLGYQSRVRTILLGILGFFFESLLYGTVYLSLPLIYFYNGERGRMNKYFYYIFYPAHLMLIYLLRDHLIPILIN